MQSENEIKSQQRKSRFINQFFHFGAYFLRRSLAFIFDICSVLALTLGSQYLQINLSPTYVLISLVSIWALTESCLKTSPGKWLLGLQIKTQPSAWKSVFIVCLRFVLLATNLLSLIWILDHFSDQFILFPYFSVDINYILAFIGLNVLLQPLTWLGSNRLNHDLFSSVQSLPIRRPILRCCVGMGFVSLTAIIMTPNFIGTYSGGKLSSVKANMHTMQTIVETHAVDWGGVYPASTAAMRKEAKNASNSYWKDFSNPLNYQGLSYLDMGQKAVPGAVIYLPVPGSESGEIIGYKIYGYDKEGKILQDKGVDFVLSNL